MQKGRKNKLLLVIDGMNQFIRNYIVLPHLSTNGAPIGGVVGMLRCIQKYVRKLNPDMVVVAWDGPNGGAKRRAMYRDYKAGRQALRTNYDILMTDKEAEENRIWQQLRAMEYLNQFPIHQIIIDGIEADDVVSLTVQDDSFAGWNKIVISSDKDFYQIVADDVILIRPNVLSVEGEDGGRWRKDEVVFIEDVLERYGVHPRNMALARAFEGDASDNIPGVPRVGIKTLVRYFPELGEDRDLTADDLVSAAERIQEERKKPLKTLESIIENKKLVLRNYRLMQLYEPLVPKEKRKVVSEGFDASSKVLTMSTIQGMLMEDQIAEDFTHLIEHYEAVRNRALFRE